MHDSPGPPNSGRYLINLRVGLHWIRWIAHEDNIIQFDVVADHGDSAFLNANIRPGVVSPILDWRLVEPWAADERRTDQTRALSS